MSGHSKWAKIKRAKGATDAERGKIFTKFGREIAVAVKEGGADPAANYRLQSAIMRAKAANMPNDTIARSIKKASGDTGANNYENIVYEGYGPAGVAIIVETLTDNRNRTAGDMRHFFDKFGGNLGQSGSVGFIFEHIGLIIIERAGETPEDKVMEDALDSGADDFLSFEDHFEIKVSPDAFETARAALEAKNYSLAQAEITYLPTSTVKISDEAAIKKMEQLLEKLEDDDDVQNVHHNWE
jgi:YebC/PmpR family DNA-binding regulatory protein